MKKIVKMIKGSDNMSGRLSENNKLEKQIEKKLKTCPDYVSSWYYNMRASDKELTSCREYIKKVSQFLESINSNVSQVKVSDINQDNVTRYMIKIKTKSDGNGHEIETSDSYQLTFWYALRNFFEYLTKNKYIEDNYMSNISKPKNKDLDRINHERKLLTEKDFNKILDAVRSGAWSNYASTRKMNERDMAIMVLFMTTGMRRAALAQIDLNDIQDNILKVVDKGNKIQEYYLSYDVLKIIGKWVIIRSQMNLKDKSALFVSKNGTRMTGQAICDVVEKYCEQALGYKVSPHKLRAGFCSIMYKETGDIEKVRRMVGHANISTTQRYIVTDNKERMESSAIMGSKLKL